MRIITLTLLLLLNATVVTFSQKNTEKSAFNKLYLKALPLVQNNDIDSAKIVAFNAFNIAANNKEKRKASFLLGHIYRISKEYNKSNKFYNLSINTQDKAWQAYVQVNIANNCMSLNKPYEAIRLGQEVVNSGFHANYLYAVYTTIGKAYANINKPDSSFAYLDKAYSKILTIKNNKILKANHFFTIAKTNEMFGRYDDAVLYYKKSQKLRNKNEDRCNVSLHLAQCYLKSNNSNLAEKYLRLAESINSGSLYNKALLLKTKGILFFKQKKLSELSLVCQKINDLLDNNLREIIKEDQLFYVKSRKELFHKRNLLQLEFDQRAISAKQHLQTVATLRLAGFLSMVFLLVIVLIIFARHKTKAKKREQLQLLSSENIGQNIVKIRSLKVVHTAKKDGTLEQENELTEDEKAKQVCDWISSNATFTLRRDT
ncbi:tetratricopeptide repeat domain protein [Microscilla marina ATCC 23134]|uniref:Tetratricopeptide repeat domain protein n=2 Tax=Microscilla marina TaxID=1027 RepID=A1ZLM7_MICM2|nr:tetratricopeptide repeat domain protein [Microscilla marina ATCC 23134]